MRTDSVDTTPPPTAPAVIHLIPCRSDDTSIVRWALAAVCMLAAAAASDPDGPLQHHYLDLADRALRRLAVLLDRRARLSRIERIMIGRVTERVLRPVEETGIIAFCEPEERFLIALRDLLLRLVDEEGDQ